MKKVYLFYILRVFALLFFLGVLLYPTISNYLAERNSARFIQSYEKQVYGLSETDKQSLLNNAIQYNASLHANNIVYDAFSNKASADKGYEKQLCVNQTSAMAYLNIPEIDVSIPIYHGSDEQVLQKGIGHLYGTSLPIGGSSTHAVLTGHRGLPKAKLFTDLDALVIGDIFYINVLGDELAYQVDQILVVEPNNTKYLSIVEGQDYVTLVTCTPYAVNTHRLLIRGIRIPYEEAVTQASNNISSVLKVTYEIKLLLGAIVIIFIIILIRRRKGS